MAIPLLAGFVAPEWMTSREGVLVWLTALVPAFLLAYYKGWHGTSVALALGMATLTSAHAALLLLGHVAPNWTLLFGVVVVYIGVSLGLGVFADLLHRARHEAEQLIQRAVYGIFQTSPGGLFLMVNPAMVRILGYDSEEELIALDSAEMVYADPSQKAGMVQRFIAAEHVERFPVQWICKDGEVVSLLFNGGPVKDDSGDVVCLEFMVEDVTDRRMLEEQLRQAQRLDALGQLAGGVAHDFNNILSVITVGAQLGMRRLGEGNPLRERFSEIKQAADRAAELTRQLLAFSRKQIVEPTVVNINWLISGMSTMLGRLISADIELSSELDETLGNVLADKGQLEQIMANLVVNARDAMPRGGQLTIRTLMMTPTVSFQRGHPGLQAEALGAVRPNSDRQHKLGIRIQRPIVSTGRSYLDLHSDAELHPRIPGTRENARVRDGHAPRGPTRVPEQHRP